LIFRLAGGHRGGWLAIVAVADEVTAGVNRGAMFSPFRNPGWGGRIQTG